jgi:glucose-6-phosphate 1-dehydrogenase
MSTVVQASTSYRPNVPALPKAEACLLVIFGASGDLTKRKLIPALYDLACVGCLSSKPFQVLGVSRTPMTTEEFRAQMKESTAGSKDARKFSDERWQEFESRLEYMSGDINDEGFYRELGKKLEEMHGAGASPNHLFYMSIPASLAMPAVKNLGNVGLAKNEKGFSRIILEKPFGRDVESARELNKTVLEVFDEKDVYRIDHYLGKETVQNILVFRFANSIFEPIWNRNYVDYVEITASEMLGVENRGAFYEETGALRDMMANHLLQLTTLTAMEAPIAFDANSVREQKVQVLRSIRPMSVEDVAENTVRGQYGPGVVDGKPVKGYREEAGVDPRSTTETYAAVKFSIDNWRWAGVPFYVRTGKRLAQPLTDIRVHFKRTPQALFSRTKYEEIDPNVITIRIQPNEGISMAIGAKLPGTQMKTIGVQMDFSYKEAFGQDTPVAYETLLLDAMRGDATLFTRGDEVEAEWKIITPIEEAWKELPAPKFPNYAAGSDGPLAAHELITGDHRKWHILEQQL